MKTSRSVLLFFMLGIGSQTSLGEDAAKSEAVDPARLTAILLSEIQSAPPPRPFAFASTFRFNTGEEDDERWWVEADLFEGRVAIERDAPRSKGVASHWIQIVRKLDKDAIYDLSRPSKDGAWTETITKGHDPTMLTGGCVFQTYGSPLDMGGGNWRTLISRYPVGEAITIGDELCVYMASSTRRLEGLKQGEKGRGCMGMRCRLRMFNGIHVVTSVELLMAPMQEGQVVGPSMGEPSFAILRNQQCQIMKRITYSDFVDYADRKFPLKYERVDANGKLLASGSIDRESLREIKKEEMDAAMKFEVPSSFGPRGARIDRRTGMADFLGTVDGTADVFVGKMVHYGAENGYARHGTSFVVWAVAIGASCLIGALFAVHRRKRKRIPW